MKVRTIFAASALVLLSLVGCSTPIATKSTNPVISMRVVNVEGDRVTLVDSKQVVNGKTVSCQERVANVNTKPNSLGGKTTEITKATDCFTQ